MKMIDELTQARRETASTRNGGRTGPATRRLAGALAAGALLLTAFGGSAARADTSTPPSQIAQPPSSQPFTPTQPVLPVKPHAAMPDLVTVTTAAGPASPATGAVFYVIVRNDGTAPARNVVVETNLDGHRPAAIDGFYGALTTRTPSEACSVSGSGVNCRLDELLPGAHVGWEIQVPVTATDRSLTALTRADPLNVVAEGDEGNNGSGVSVLVSPKP